MNNTIVDMMMFDEKKLTSLLPEMKCKTVCGLCFVGYLGTLQKVQEAPDYDFQLVFLVTDKDGKFFTLSVVMEMYEANFNKVRESLPEFDLCGEGNRSPLPLLITSTCTDKNHMVTDMTHLYLATIFCQDVAGEIVLLHATNQIFGSLEIFRSHFLMIDTTADGKQWAKSLKCGLSTFVNRFDNLPSSGPIYEFKAVNKFGIFALDRDDDASTTKLTILLSMEVEHEGDSFDFLVSTITDAETALMISYIYGTTIGVEEFEEFAEPDAALIYAAPIKQFNRETQSVNSEMIFGLVTPDTNSIGNGMIHVSYVTEHFLAIGEYLLNNFFS